MTLSRRIRQVIGAAIGAAIAAAISTGLAMPAAERHERIFGTGVPAQTPLESGASR